MNERKLIKLEKERKKNNYTYDKMAELLSISKSYYWQLENNNRRLSYEMACKIAQIFNKKPDELFYDYQK